MHKNTSLFCLLLLFKAKYVVWYFCKEKLSCNCKKISYHIIAAADIQSNSQNASKGIIHGFFLKALILLFPTSLLLDDYSAVNLI